MKNTGAKNSVGRVIYRGHRGGLFVILPGGSKKYIKELPKNHTRSQPGNTNRSQPGNTNRSQPGNTNRSQPGNTNRSQPGNTNRTQPGNRKSLKPNTTTTNLGKNSMGRVIHRGAKGGLYVLLPGGGKKYIKLNPSPVPPRPKPVPPPPKPKPVPPPPPPPKPVMKPNVRTRVQQGGTCWFHAIVNGLLMSSRPRNLLIKMVADVPSVNFSGDACPSKKPKREWFLKYIKHRLEGPGPVHDVFTNWNVIRGSGLRGLGMPGVARYSKHTIKDFLKGTRGNRGGDEHDMRWLYNKMFPKRLFVIKQFGDYYDFLKGANRNPEVPHSLVRHGVKYELTHAWIVLCWYKPDKKPETHAIAGYKTATGRYAAYDSAAWPRNDQILAWDWTKTEDWKIPDEWVKTQRRGSRLFAIQKHAVYMRGHPLPNLA